LAFTFGTLALLAQGQDLAPLSSPPTIEQAAGQQSNLPELTLEEAVEQAIANNSSVKIATLDTLRAADDLAANKTRRFANTAPNCLRSHLLLIRQARLGYTAQPGRFRRRIRRSRFRENP